MLRFYYKYIKIMKKNIFVLFVMFFGAYGFSQQINEPLDPLPHWIKSEKSLLKFTGTPYLEDDFVYGSINDEAGNSHYAFLRYNAIEEIVEIKIPQADQLGIQVLPKNNNLSYSLKDYKYIFDSFITSEGERIEGYLIEYYDGYSFGLYGNPNPKLNEAQRARTGYDRDKPAHLSVEVDYYIKKEDGTLHSVKLNRRAFKKELPPSQELSRYMSNNRLKTPQDFAELLRWLEIQQTYN